MIGVFNSNYKGEHALSGVQRAGRSVLDKILGREPIKPY